MEVTSEEQSKQLLELKKIGDMTVKITTHVLLNSPQGMVYCRDLVNCTEEEIVEEPKTWEWSNVNDDDGENC